MNLKYALVVILGVVLILMSEDTKSKHGYGLRTITNFRKFNLLGKLGIVIALLGICLFAFK